MECTVEKVAHVDVFPQRFLGENRFLTSRRIVHLLTQIKAYDLHSALILSQNVDGDNGTGAGITHRKTKTDKLIRFIQKSFLQIQEPNNEKTNEVKQRRQEVKDRKDCLPEEISTEELESAAEWTR